MAGSAGAAAAAGHAICEKCKISLAVPQPAAAAAAAPVRAREPALRDPAPAGATSALAPGHSSPRSPGQSGANDTFIFLRSRQEGASAKTSRARSRSLAPAAADQDLMDYRQIENKRELLSHAFGPGAEQPVELAELQMLRPLIPSVAQAEAAVAREGAASPQPFRKSLCGECLNTVQGYLRRELLEHIQIQFKLREFKSRLEQSEARPKLPPHANGGSGLSVQAETEQLAKRLGELTKELCNIDSEWKEVQREEAKLDKEERELAKEEEEFWREYGQVQNAGSVVSEQRDSLLRRVKRTKMALKQLDRIHAFNDSFFIWTEGDYGTINGFRLGQLLGASTSEARKPKPQSFARPPTNWEEINTAWGLSAMLLSAIAQSCAFEFAGFQIKPMGARSNIQRLLGGKSALGFRSSTVYPLYLDPARNVFNSVFKNRVEDFNKAMRAFLVCLSQLSDVALQTETGRNLGLAEKLHHISIPDEQLWHKELPVDSATIHGYSIDLKHPASRAKELEEKGQSPPPPVAEVDASFRWTLVLRYMLTNLKWLLVWSVKEKRAPQHVL